MLNNSTIKHHHCRAPPQQLENTICVAVLLKYNLYSFASATFDPSTNFHETFRAVMTTHGMMQRKETKLVTRKSNQAPYHIISQCFYVYVLLEGGHSMKNTTQKKMQHQQSIPTKVHSHVQCQTHFPIRNKAILFWN